MAAVLPAKLAKVNRQPRPDPTLVMSSIALAMLGLVMVCSTSISIAESHGVGPLYFLNRHAFFLLLGSVAAAMIWFVPLRTMERFSPLMAFAAFGLLLLVFVPGIGVRINGARRWINLGVSTFQVVELVKLFVIMYVAGYLVRHQQSVQTSLSGIIKPLAVVTVLVGLLLMQPDFGGSVLLIGIVVGMLWLGGASAGRLAGIGLIALPLLVVVAQLEAYRLKRLTTFLNPWADPFNDGFQLTQALIAIGRGEWFGVGLGDSVQKLFYLPEAHTDFIVAVIAEELGFAGLVVVIGLFAVLAGRAFRLGLAAYEADKVYAGSVAYGIGLWISLQAGVSIGVNLGVLPTKGLTLPFVSSGGSSVLMSCIAVGVLIRIAREMDYPEPASRKRSPNKAGQP